MGPIDEVQLTNCTGRERGLVAAIGAAARMHGACPDSRFGGFLGGGRREGGGM